MKKIVVLNIIALVCWGVMFLSGTDVWHYAGSPDFWHLSGPPHTDLRAFGYAFYFQLLIILGMISVGIWSEIRKRKYTVEHVS